MPDNRLFIYHINKDHFMKNEEHYLMAWFGERSHIPPPFQEAGLSHNIFDLRRDILRQLNNLMNDSMTIDLLRDEIGKKLKTILGLNALFTNVQKYAGQEISIRTNDVEIPWEWVYFEDKEKFLCELFPYGKIFLEEIKLISLPRKPIRSCDKRIEDQLKESVVLILYDKGGSEGLEKLPYVEDEINILIKLFKNSGIPSENIFPIDGSKTEAESDFIKVITTRRENLKIIHFAGHIMKDSLLMSNGGRIECSEIMDITADGKLNAPLVFLNGCFSANIVKEWKQEKNLSTAFLISGASGCICTRMSIGDENASNFSRIFYKKLLSKDEDAPTTIGSVLQTARQEFKASCSTKDFSWLLYTLYGNPSCEIFPRLSAQNLATQAPNKKSMNTISKFTV